MPNIIKLKSISVAKQEFTKLVREAVKGHEIMAGNAKTNDAETISILATDDLIYMLDIGFKFHVEVSNDEDGFVITIRDIAMFGYGLTFEEAKTDLLENIEEYLQDYFTRFEFFKAILQRREHYPYMRRLAKCQSREEIAEVVFECFNLHSTTSQE